jgi:GNAT superfamily N-acetyltransferase
MSAPRPARRRRPPATASPAPTPPPAIETRDLRPEDFPLLERLFGPSGACAGCWCMWWRLGPGEQLRDIAGAEARRRQEALVESGRSRGALAFVGGEPVGWVAWARRTELPRLARSRTLACDDADRVHSIPCFFVRAGHRGRGVARALLRHAVRSLRREGATLLEGYPVALGRKVSNAEAYTGTVPFFESEGFRVVTGGGPGRQRARKALRRR